MIDLSIIEEVLEEQLLDIQAMSKQKLCSRREECLVHIDSKLAQVAIGVRRSGKSSLCYNALTKAGVTYAYVNFDDERFANIQVEDLNNILLVLSKIHGDFNYLFLDEVQDVPGWHLFVNRLLRRGMHIIITGSNAKLLSGELATYLSGRSTEIPLYPFSFKEYCEYNGVNMTSKTTVKKAERLSAFDMYLKQGGFPELLAEPDAVNYINTLVNNIVNNDIIRRHKINFKATFEQLMHHLLNNAPCEISYDNLKNVVNVKSHHTIKNYIDYAEKAYLISLCKKWSPKSGERVRLQKVYPIDVAIMNSRDDAFVGDNLGFRLETIVYIELLRRHKAYGRNIYFYKESIGETDFVVCEKNKVLEVIQVSYDISSPKTRKRELKGLILASQATKCNNLTLITRHNQESTIVDGKDIKIVPAYDWLVDC